IPNTASASTINLFNSLGSCCSSPIQAQKTSKCGIVARNPCFTLLTRAFVIWEKDGDAEAAGPISLSSRGPSGDSSFTSPLLRHCRRDHAAGSCLCRGCTPGASCLLQFMVTGDCSSSCCNRHSPPGMGATKSVAGPSWLDPSLALVECHASYWFVFCSHQCST